MCLTRKPSARVYRYFDRLNLYFDLCSQVELCYVQMVLRQTVTLAYFVTRQSTERTVCNLYTVPTRSPVGAGIANRPLVFLGIFLIFGSNTPTWSVENQLNLWAINCVVNQTGYFGPLYASRHQTSLWRHQHIYYVQLPQTGWLSGRVSDLRSKGRRFEPRP